MWSVRLTAKEDFDDPSHPGHELIRGRRQPHRHVFEEVDAEVLAASLREAGFANAQGARTTLAGRPAKVVRANRNP